MLRTIKNNFFFIRSPERECANSFFKTFIVANFRILAIFPQNKKTKHERIIQKVFLANFEKKNERNSPNLNLGEILVVFFHKILA
jgi:hypothetical protein